MDNLVHLLVTSQSGLFFSSGYCNPLVPRSQPHTTSFLICPSGLSSFPSLFWISPRNFKFSFYFVEQFLIPLNLCSQTWAHIYISQLLHAQQNKRDFHVTNVFRRLSLYVGPMFSAVVIQHCFVFFFSSITPSLKVSNDTNFRGGPVVKNLSANAGDMGSIPGPEDPTCHGAIKPMRHNY